MSAQRAYWLAWQRIEGIGPHRLQGLIETFGDLRSAWEAPLKDLQQVPGLGETILERIRQHRSRVNLTELLEGWEAKYGPCWTPDDAAYPELLLEIADTPPVLYYRGVRPVWQPAVAIVGTRNPTVYGLHWAKQLAYELTCAGFLVVSGLASGVDAAAHWGALDAGGVTVAVLGCGVDHCYPHENLVLYQQIRERGLILSEHPLTTPPATANFPRRNRILAGMTQATIVIEAGERSGALITARLAVDYGRDVLALPGQLGTPQATGALSLVNQGAQLILGVEDLLQKLGATPRGSVFTPQKPEITELTSLEQSVLSHLNHEPRSMEQLLVISHLGTGELAATLLLLEIKGLAYQHTGLRYSR